jgi:carbon storage regulator
MLVLTRKAGERILIGDSICLTVLEVRENRIRLGVTAPADVRVWRDELRLRLLETAASEADAPTDLYHPDTH